MDDYVRIVLENMRHRQVRSWLTVLGIVIGVAAIVALITVSSGFKSAVEYQFDKMGLSNIRVTPANLMGPPAGELGVPVEIARRVESLKSVEYVSPVLMDYVPVGYNNEEVFSWAVGYDTSLGDKGFLDADLDVAEGRFFNQQEGDSAIIGAGVAEDAFGKEVHIKNSLQIDGVSFRVVGILERTGTEIDDRIQIPLESSQELFSRTEVYNVLVVKLKPGITMDSGEAEIRRELSDEIDDEIVDVFTPEQLLSQFTRILDIVQLVLVGIAAISLVVGAVGIMNSMFTSVLERTRDIGVMKAIGATNSHVMLLFLIEAGIIGALGGAIGLLLGSGIAGLINVAAAFAGFAWLRIRVQLGVVLFALGFSFLIGAASGLLPALRAARLNPVDALRYE